MTPDLEFHQLGIFGESLSLFQLISLIAEAQLRPRFRVSGGNPSFKAICLGGLHTIPSTERDRSICKGGKNLAGWSTFIPSPC